MQREQKKLILNDLKKKIVLLVGPRQAGKTWLAKEIALEFPHSIYLNYDQQKDQDIIHNQSWLESTDLLVLDELHKMPNWKNYLKGLYDTKPQNLRLLVTGSARLDVYDKMGDSLAGRYFRHRLLPLTLAELNKVKEPINLDKLILRGGFPESYLADTDLDANRWRLQYINSLLSTDIFEFDKIHNVKAVKLLFDLLRHRVGSPISYASLARDIQASPTTVKRYIEVLEALFIVFRVTPYSNNIARSLLKEPKIYFFDTGLVLGEDGVKLENAAAVSLLKSVYAKVDYEALECNLHYIRTKDGLEVDFALTQDNQLNQIIEIKLAANEVSKPLVHFSEKCNCSAIQLVKQIRNEYQHAGVKVLNAQKFLANLNL